VSKEIPPRDELEKMIIQGLSLRLEAVRRKNFKGRRRGSDMKLSRKEKLAAMSCARSFVKAFFRVQRDLRWLVSPN
jgi:hypothetical protein